MRNSVWFLGLCGVATLCQAGINPIPKESGFSGYGSLSASYSRLNSNVVVGGEGRGRVSGAGRVRWSAIR